MNRCFTIVCCIIFLNQSDAQPWKIEKQFKDAFFCDTSLIIHVTHQKGKSCIQVFDKEDTTIKLFEYEELESDHKKDGVFKAYYKDGGTYYTLLFKDGCAKQLTIDLPDSMLGRYTIDSGFFNGVHTTYYKNGNLKEYGFYKDNARIGEWTFFNSAGKVISRGSYLGDYNKILLNVTRKEIITLNRFLDTIKVGNLTQAAYDSLKQLMHQNWGVAFPLHLHFEEGNWKYYDDSGRLIKEEYYDKGKLIKSVSRW
jgi:antitoxin component YwqK of YwqJK toxin-antitoxin module